MRELGNRKNLNILDLERKEKIKEAVKRAFNAPLNPPELSNSAPTLGFPFSLAGFS
jgi:hypothetical protein